MQKGKGAKARHAARVQQCGDDLADGLARRQTQLRFKLVERNEHKQPFAQGLVGNVEKGLVHLYSVVEQDVDVNDPRAPSDRRLALQAVFDGLRDGEQRFGAQGRVHARHGVQEGVLRGEADRGGLIQRRDGLHGDGRMLVQACASTHEVLLAVSEVRA